MSNVRRVCLSLYFMLASTIAFAIEPTVELGQNINANVIFMRHALAPGFGDPANFNVDDCATQRNLDAQGQAQARAIGAYFRSHDVRFDRVLSSEWCRCQDTARLMDLGPVQSFSGLNSFFQNYADRDTVLRQLRAELETISPKERVLMVTHQVVISAITGRSTRSGGMVAYNSQTGESVDLPMVSN